MDTEDFSCVICKMEYGDDHPPHTLSCGHSLCGQCLQQIFTRNKKCPECRSDIKATTIEDIPVSYTLLRLVRSVRNIQGQQLTGATPSGSEKDRHADAGECKAHGSLMFFRCQRCSVWVCRDCLVVDHPEPLRGNCRIVSITKALEEARESSQKTTQSELGRITSLSTQLEATESKLLAKQQQLQKVIDQHTEKIKTVVSNCGKIRENLRRMEALPPLLTRAEEYIIEAQTPQDFTKATETAGVWLASVRNVAEEAENLLKQFKQGSTQRRSIYGSSSQPALVSSSPYAVFNSFSGSSNTRRNPPSFAGSFNFGK